MNLEKFHGTHFGPLKTRDFYQMAGRAGRRGMDPEGFVYSRINPQYIDFEEVKKHCVQPQRTCSKPIQHRLCNRIESVRNF